jgi:hypothetical protein
MLFSQLTKYERIKTLRENAETFQQPLGFVNNHIHTSYSFSPYSPTAAVYYAKKAGLESAGIMDHDSISGAEEFIEAGQILTLPTTIGVECRANFKNSALADKYINHPDQKSCAYVAIHAIPHDEIKTIEAFFKPYILERVKRNRLMVNKLNKLIETTGISINYYNDIELLSEFANGGTVTERHILFGLAVKLISLYGKGAELIKVLSERLGISVTGKACGYLDDKNNPHYEYDLLGALKTELLPSIYIEAESECPSPEQLVELSKDTGSILAYAYLGDVHDSVTGDKKTQNFEDSYIELLFSELKRIGFNAVTYMPSRNSIAQLLKIQRLCARNDLLEISGEDINSSRQSFICETLKRKEFIHLADMTWALIGHEKSATKDKSNGFFSPKIAERFPTLKDRINYFKNIGLSY